MEETKDNVEEERNKTIYEEAVEISPQQLSAMWNLFPYPVRKSLKKAKKNELQEITDSQLKKITENL